MVSRLSKRNTEIFSDQHDLSNGNRSSTVANNSGIRPINDQADIIEEDNKRRYHLSWKSKILIYAASALISFLIFLAVFYFVYVKLGIRNVNKKSVIHENSKRKKQRKSILFNF
jgi:hypothetical protein